MSEPDYDHLEDEKVGKKQTRSKIPDGVTRIVNTATGDIKPVKPIVLNESEVRPDKG